MGEERLTLRKLTSADFGKGFLQLLGQLSVVGNVTEEQFNGKSQVLHSAMQKLCVASQTGLRLTLSLASGCKWRRPLE